MKLLTSRILRLISFVAAFGILLTTAPTHAQPEEDRKAEEELKPDAETIFRALRPPKLEATDERIESLELPDGFEINVFARDLGQARMLETGPDGTIYVTTPKEGEVKALRDEDGDGVAESTETIVSGIDLVHGILLHEGKLYLASPQTVWVTEQNEDGSWAKPDPLYKDLPDGGQHPNRTLGAGPDGNLYISVGSSCNACPETNPEHGTLLRAKFDGSERSVFANGLRNTIGFGWHPETQELWGMDHGSDGRGDDIPPEELNRIVEGAHYGWPWIYGKRQTDPLMGDPSGTTKEAFAERTEPAVMTYQAHSAPIGMAIYDSDQFPERYRSGAFIAMRGSWNRFPATGYKIVFLGFENGEPQQFEDFVTGFLVGDGLGHFGRLAGVAVARDGSLVFTDDANSVIYRVTYAGE